MCIYIFKAKLKETKLGTNQARKYWSPRRPEYVSLERPQNVL